MYHTSPQCTLFKFFASYLLPTHFLHEKVWKIDLELLHANRLYFAFTRVDTVKRSVAAGMRVILSQDFSNPQHLEIHEEPAMQHGTAQISIHCLPY